MKLLKDMTMPTFDLIKTDFTPWLADRLLSDHFIDERRRAAFLWRHFRGAGLLGGLDLANGTKYEILRPADPEAFFLAHTLGPARINTPPTVIGTAEDGPEVELSSFFRTTTRHVDVDGRCPFLLVRFDGHNSLRPGSVIIRASNALHGVGFPHTIERSFQIGVWNLWIFFEASVSLQQAKKVAASVREAIESAGVGASVFKIPLIEGESLVSYLPYHFFSGDYFANLHRLDGNNGLVALNPNKIEVLEIPGLRLSKPVIVQPENRPCFELRSLFEAWYAWKGSRPVRAGELTDLIADQSITLNQLASFETRQAKAINLGRVLMEVASTNSIQGWRIEVGKSGNSNVFRLERIN